jgi:hypothetical protein
MLEAILHIIGYFPVIGIFLLLMPVGFFELSGLDYLVETSTNKD